MTSMNKNGRLYQVIHSCPATPPHPPFKSSKYWIHSLTTKGLSLKLRSNSSIFSPFFFWKKKKFEMGEGMLILLLHILEQYQ